MSLTSALQVGRSGLLTSQAAIETAGNNLSNIATRGYHRQELVVSPSGANEISNGVFVGRGVQISEIIRRIDTALESRLRGSIADQSSALARQEVLSQIESIQNELTGTDLTTALNEFFNAFGELSNQPLDTSLRTLVVSRGDTLSQQIQELRRNLVDLRTQVEGRLTSGATRADDLLSQIESVSTQIVASEGGQGGANSLRDQRDVLLGELSKYLDISVNENPSGSIDVFVGSIPIMLNGKSRGVEVRTTSAGSSIQHDLVVSADGSTLLSDTGELGALMKLRQEDLVDAIQGLDDFTGALIQQVNQVHSQGQGSTGFSTLTGETIVADTAVALNDPTAGLAFPPQHGSFQIHVTQKSTGQRVSTTINVDLDGINPAADTSLTSLAADLNGVTNLTATVTSNGKLRLAADSSDFVFSFSDDTSGALASLGVNTFFTGGNSFDIGVNQVILNDASKVAAARDHIAGDNRNALALVGLRTQKLEALGGRSLPEVWSANVEKNAIKVSQAVSRVEATSVVRETLESQKQQFSGVNVDEEAINLLSFQRMFQASARFLNVVDQMMETLLQLA
ncbi:MAG: flagellar hook-associated protein FlgK [Phycisphaeraceae bacterium]